MPGNSASAAKQLLPVFALAFNKLLCNKSKNYNFILSFLALVSPIQKIKNINLLFCHLLSTGSANIFSIFFFSIAYCSKMTSPPALTDSVLCCGDSDYFWHSVQYTVQCTALKEDGNRRQGKGRRVGAGGKICSIPRRASCFALVYL